MDRWPLPLHPAVFVWAEIQPEECLSTMHKNRSKRGTKYQYKKTRTQEITMFAKCNHKRRRNENITLININLWQTHIWTEHYTGMTDLL